MRALVTGVTGQDGYYLAQELVNHGYRVFGLVRWTSRAKWREELAADLPGVTPVYGDLQDETSLRAALIEAKPDVVYNLAALASSGQSWQQPMMMGQINALGVLRLLEAVKDFSRDVRLIQASTSEQYGQPDHAPQDVYTPFRPTNVYGTAKTFAHHAVVNYRDSYGMHASTALMFNHVSPRRHPYFVDRKISRAAASVALGLSRELRLGDLSPRRDWGWGPDFMQAWRLIGEQDKPGDYILCTGRTHSVAEFAEQAFGRFGLSWAKYVTSDPALFRPTDIEELRGDPSGAWERLRWQATVPFDEIVRRLVDQDYAELQAGA